MTMAATVNRPELDRLQELITAQLGVLRASRSRADRSATAENLELARLAGVRLDGLISQWCHEKIRQQAEDIADGRWKP